MRKDKLESRRARNTRRVRMNLSLRANPDRLWLKFHRGNRTLVSMIVDWEGRCLLYMTDRNLPKGEEPLTRSERASVMGRELGRRASGLGAVGFVLDRKWYRYHGVLRNFVEGFRCHCVV